MSADIREIDEMKPMGSQTKTKKTAFYGFREDFS